MPQDIAAHAQTGNQTPLLMSNLNSTVPNNVTSTEADHENTTLLENTSTTLVNLETVTQYAGADVFFWVTLACTIEMIISTCCIGVALTVMKQCRKIPKSIRYISINFLVAMLIGNCNTLIHSAGRFSIGTNGDSRLLIDSRSLFTSMFISLTWCSLCFITLERFVALIFPLNYVQYVTKATLSISIVLIWAFNILTPPLIFGFNWLNICGTYDFVNSCDRFAMFHSIRMFMLSQLCVYCSITVVTYIKISLIIRRHKREIGALTVHDQNPSHKDNAISSSLPSTNIIVTIILSFIILQSPILFSVFIFEFRPNLQQQQQVRSLLFSIIFIFGEINTYVTLYLYVWKFEECRMNFYRMLSKLSDKYRPKAEELRRNVFNIVTVSQPDSIDSTM